MNKKIVGLRDLQPDDQEMIRRWRNLPEIAKYMYTDQYITPEKHRQWFQKITSDVTYRYWIIVYDGVDIGLVNLYNLDQKNQRCYWAFYIAAATGRGTGTGSMVEYLILNYVFDKLQLNKLCCEVLEFNKAVVNMHKKFGFQEEGFYREHIKKGDQFLNVFALAMLRTEWETNRPRIEKRLAKRFDLSQYRNYMDQFPLNKVSL